MNMFFPYLDIKKSVIALDDVRLNKQILECYQILRVIRGESEGYKNHPITKHYMQYPFIVWYYGIQCCAEKYYRTNTAHKCCEYFINCTSDYADEFSYCEKCVDVSHKVFYAEYAKTDPKCIRTTDPIRVTELYKQKLNKKWHEDEEAGYPPKWTNRHIPEFYCEYKLRGNNE